MAKTGEVPGDAEKPLDKGALLGGSPLFSALSADARSDIAATLVRRRYERDAAVYLRGDEAVALYGVAEGRIRFSAASPDGKEYVLDYAGAGQWFGEIGLFDEGPRVVDATAAEPSTLFVLARRELLAVCRREPELMLGFLALFSRRIRAAEDIIVDAAFLALPARLARRLLVLADDAACAESDSRGTSLRISQDELGRLAGVTRESAGRQLKLWEREGLVEIDYGRVRIVDAARLKRIVTVAFGE